VVHGTLAGACPILLAGRMVGFAVAAEAGLVFTALDPRLEDLSGARFPSAAEARRVAALVLAREIGAVPAAA
jgi:hypothetical protein